MTGLVWCLSSPFSAFTNGYNERIYMEYQSSPNFSTTSSFTVECWVFVFYFCSSFSLPSFTVRLYLITLTYNLNDLQVAKNNQARNQQFAWERTCIAYLHFAWACRFRMGFSDFRISERLSVDFPIFTLFLWASNNDVVAFVKLQCPKTSS